MLIERHIRLLYVICVDVCMIPSSVQRKVVLSIFPLQGRIASFVTQTKSQSIENLIDWKD